MKTNVEMKGREAGGSARKARVKGLNDPDFKRVYKPDPVVRLKTIPVPISASRLSSLLLSFASSRGQLGTQW